MLNLVQHLVVLAFR